LQLLSKRLDDVHLDVRRKARRLLLELAGDQKWHKQVVEDASAIMQGESWRGLEQATILLVQLDQKQVAGRLVELLQSNRTEVKVSAAWGLRKLDVPETLPGLVRYIEEEIKPRPVVKAPRAQTSDQPAVKASTSEAPPSVDIRDYTNSQLLQLLGQQKYRPAEALLRRFIPKSAFASLPESRAAAIWALGMIHEGKIDDALAAALEERLMDSRRPPEDFRVRWMSAIALGRMKAKNSLESLRSQCPFFKPSSSPISNACGWAIEQITGEKMPPPETLIRYRSDWFLIPDQWGSPSKASDGARG
jgi:HEAT repeat protein